MAGMTSLAFVAVALVLGGQGAADMEAVLRPALGPYYAALAASNHGDVDGTQRQLLLFQARWEGASKLARSSVPDVLRNDPAWGEALDFATSALGRARAALRVGDVGGAHAELESIRLRLREVRASHNMESIDDRLWDFHGAMERLISRISARNEIVLTAADWDSIGPQLEAAKTALTLVDAAAWPALRQSAPWAAAFKIVQTSLGDLDRAVAGRDGFSASKVAGRLHDRYYDLLLALAKIG
jgi:hypothetical protein